MNYDTTLVYLKSVTDQLRARYQTLDTIGVTPTNGPSTERSVVHMLAPSSFQQSATASLPVSIQALTAGEFANASGQSVRSSGTTDPSSQPTQKHVAATERPKALEVHRTSQPRPQRTVASVRPLQGLRSMDRTSTPQPKDGSRPPPPKHVNPVVMEELYAQVMSEFGYPVPLRETVPAVPQDHNDEPQQLESSASRASSASSATQEVGMRCEPRSQLGEANEDGTRRPLTPNVVKSVDHTRLSSIGDSYQHQPDVLVVHDFDDDDVGRNALGVVDPVAINATEVSSPSRKVAQRTNSSSLRLPADVGAPVFSTRDINSLLATVAVPLNMTKRNELFDAAQRAFLGVVGSKEATTHVYKEIANVCRSAESNVRQSADYFHQKKGPPAALQPLRSVGDVFAAITREVTLQHSLGSQVPDDRSRRHRSLVPGGQSCHVAATVAQTFHRPSHEVLLAAPGADASDVFETRPSVPHQSESAQRGRTRSPLRVPHRVIRTPHITSSLPQELTRVRHASAKRRVDTFNHSIVSPMDSLLITATQSQSPRRSHR